MTFKDEGSDSATQFTDMMHPHTYVNKLLFCGHVNEQPVLQLINIVTQKKVYSFANVFEAVQE